MNREWPKGEWLSRGYLRGDYFLRRFNLPCRTSQPETAEDVFSNEYLAVEDFQASAASPARAEKGTRISAGLLWNPCLLTGYRASGVFAPWLCSSGVEDFAPAQARSAAMPITWEEDSEDRPWPHALDKTVHVTESARAHSDI